MDIGIIFMFLGIAVLSCVNCATSATGMIARIGTDSPHYPVRYAAPARWVRSVFKVSQRLIPRYLYFELLLSLFFAALGPINITIYIFMAHVPDIVGVLVFFHIALIILNMVFFSIMSFMFKRK